jgi:NADPH:quinone reductase-like Zn-dependent oxidoreductase
MKAFVVERYGEGGLRAADVPEPEVGDGDVLVKVSAAAINPLDKMVRNGEFKRLLKYQTPFVLGHDVAGVVTRVGSAVGVDHPEFDGDRFYLAFNLKKRDRKRKRDQPYR